MAYATRVQKGFLIDIFLLYENGPPKGLLYPTNLLPHPLTIQSPLRFCHIYHIHAILPLLLHYLMPL